MRRMLDDRMDEDSWQRQVLAYAGIMGWWSYHPYDSRRSAPGWPDLGLIRPPRLVLAELKREKAKPTRAQSECLGLLAGCPGVEVYLWRPSDWPEVERILAR
jgi:hypothetical protein